MHLLYRQDATNASLNISSLRSFYTCAHMSNRSSFPNTYATHKSATLFRISERFATSRATNTLVSTNYEKSFIKITKNYMLNYIYANYNRCIEL